MTRLCSRRGDDRGPALTDAHLEPHPFRWVIFGAMCGVYVAFGIILLAIPPMVTQVRSELGISRSSLGFALGAWALLYIVTAPPAGRFIDRIGLRRSLTAGSLLVATSAAVQSAARGTAMLWLAIGIIGIGGPLVSLSAPKLVTTWFTSHRERPLAVGLYTSAPALGGVCALLLTNSVLLPVFGDWRSVLLFEAALSLLAALVWMLVSGRAPSEPVVFDPLETVTLRATAAARALFASTGVRLAMLLGIGTFFITQGLAAWLPDILEEDSGISAGAASNWAAGSLAVGIFARLVIPGLASPERRSLLLYGVMIALGASMIVMAFGPARTDLAAVLVLGLRATLSSLVIVVLMEAEQVTAANAGLAYGLWFSAVGIGGAVGPLVIGAFGDSGVGFPGALTAMAIVLAAMMALLFRDDRRQRRRETRIVDPHRRQHV
jgi:MFS transporter, CP family, cyanate transporter